MNKNNFLEKMFFSPFASGLIDRCVTRECLKEHAVDTSVVAVALDHVLTNKDDE